MIVWQIFILFPNQTKSLPFVCLFFLYFELFWPHLASKFEKSINKSNKIFWKNSVSVSKNTKFYAYFKKVENIAKNHKFFHFYSWFKTIWVTIFLLNICSTFSPICCATNVTVAFHQSKNLDLKYQGTYKTQKST